MHKRLRFASDLVPLILSEAKVSTWRLWDDKELTEDDIVDFVSQDTNKCFAKAKLSKIIKKPLGELTEKDKVGHEKFVSNEEMYETYTKYYGRKVDENSIVKIIWFKIIF